MNTSSLLEPVLLKLYDRFELSLQDIMPVLAYHDLVNEAGQKPDLSKRDEAAKTLLEGAKLWSGLAGLTLGPGGIFTLIPTLFSGLKTQMRLVQSLAWVYEKTPKEKQEKLLVWELVSQGLSKKDSMLTASSGVFSTPVAQSIFRRLLQGYFKRLGIGISSEVATRLIPFTGALIQGFANVTLSSRVGNLAYQHYRALYLEKLPETE